MRIISVVALLMLCYVPFSSAETVLADTLVQPDTSVVKTDTSVVRTDTSSMVDENTSDTVAEDFANRLKSQLNLADDQTDKVKSVISSYVKNYDGDSKSSENAGEQITKILNDTQRSSWLSVKDAFWSDLNRRIKDEKN